MNDDTEITTKLVLETDDGGRYEYPIDEFDISYEYDDDLTITDRLIEAREDGD